MRLLWFAKCCRIRGVFWLHRGQIQDPLSNLVGYVLSKLWNSGQEMPTRGSGFFKFWVSKVNSLLVEFWISLFNSVLFKLWVSVLFLDSGKKSLQGSPFLILAAGGRGGSWDWETWKIFLRKGSKIPSPKRNFLFPQKFSLWERGNPSPLNRQFIAKSLTEGKCWYLKFKFR